MRKDSRLRILYSCDTSAKHTGISLPTPTAHLARVSLLKFDNGKLDSFSQEREYVLA